MAVCAFGRGLDFATTWVGLHSHRALEAKPIASTLIEWGGSSFGLVAWEFLITTPVIFFGWHLAKRLQARRRTRASGLPMGCALLYSVGIISTIAAVHNAQFLF